jgi:predicted nucleic acid-binding protein
MSRLFWDTSALVRRYAQSEGGSSRVVGATRLNQGDQHLVSRLLPAELASACALKVRTGELNVQERDRTWALFQVDLQLQYEVVELTAAVWRLAEELLFRHPLRAGDALHLAAAITVWTEDAGATLVFWTADRQQARAAENEGLRVELLA